MNALVHPLEDNPALRRLDRLSRLDSDAIEALRAAVERSQIAERGSNLATEGKRIAKRILILEGWAGRVRVFEDGRMQIMSFVLPGDLIGNCSHKNPVSVSTMTALTDVRYCEAPSPDVSPTLCEAYAVSRAFEEAHLLAHIARLGRLSAEERLVDLLLELNERLELCGLAQTGGFDLPLTQTTLADATGLTVVHVNRTLRQLRLEGRLSWTAGALRLSSVPVLSLALGRQITRVNATD